MLVCVLWRQEYCVSAYNILRKHGNLLITLFFLMLSSGECCYEEGEREDCALGTKGQQPG